MRGMKENKRKWQNLDIISLSLEKDKDIIVFVNGSIFLRFLTYHFYKQDNKYASFGMLDKVWDLLSRKRFGEGSNLLDSIFPYLKMESSFYFAKFVSSLFQDLESYSYLKKCIELHKNREYDDKYFLYLELYSKIDSDYDTESLKEYLHLNRQLVIFSKKSYNGIYSMFLDYFHENKLEDAMDQLKLCIQMKPDSLHLSIVEKLLDIITRSQEELLLKQKEQEKKLENERCQKLIDLIKDKNYEGAKEQVELILAYRNLEDKNNYSYQLFWELLEMITVFSNDVSFEILEVSYTYKKEKDALYTFREAISLGDFKKALEVGKKCSRKAVDSSEPKLKVSLYLGLLKHLFERLEERKKDRDHIYKVVQNNIKRGHYIHALELYENNKIALRSYQEALILDLFLSGIALEKKEPIVTSEEKATFEQLTINSKEVVEEPEKKDFATSSVEKDTQDTMAEEKKEEVFYPVEPLLAHLYPTHEYFTYFVKCFQYGQYEEAKYWLNQYGLLLRTNQVEKRLDYYYYQVEVAYMESLEKTTSKKEELYGLAYSAMRNFDYERAFTYLNYYQKMDTCRNNKAGILKGYIYMKMGKYEQAITEFIKANAISPNPDAYYFLGEIYYKQHRWRDAIFCYLTYNEFFPKENITVYLNLSECYKRLNNSTKSLKYLKLAEELNQSQKKGLSLHNRLLRTEMLNEKKEKFRLMEGKKEEVIQ